MSGKTIAVYYQYNCPNCETTVINDGIIEGYFFCTKCLKITFSNKKTEVFMLSFESMDDARKHGWTNLPNVKELCKDIVDKDTKIKELEQRISLLEGLNIDI